MSGKALVFVEKGKVEIQDVSKPTLRDDYILVKINTVGINPTDQKHVDVPIAQPGCRVGCDYAGTVEEVGSKVTKSWKKGDRIAGFIHGANILNKESGAFANYGTAKGDVQIKIPDNMSDEEAATFGISILTVGQGMYQALALRYPGSHVDKSEWLLIHGGSTATGIWGIQFAKLSGYKVVATSSPHNFDYLKSLGADAVFDYSSPTAGEDINKATGNSLKYAWACVPTGADLCGKALSTEGGKYAVLVPVDEEAFKKANPKADGPHRTMGYTAFGEPIKIGPMETPATPEDFEAGKKIVTISEKLLAEGKLKVPNLYKNRGGKGLDGVITGLDELRNNKVSGGKLVYNL